MRVRRKVAAAMAMAMVMTSQPFGVLADGLNTLRYTYGAVQEDAATRSEADKSTESTAEPDIPEDEKETFAVTYLVDPEEGASVSGNRKVETGDTLKFNVTVKKGFELDSVDVSGDILEPVKESENRYWYEAEDILQEPEVNISLHESEYPSFSQSESFDGVTVTVSAEEGVLPEGTYAEILEVPAPEVMDLNEEEEEETASFYFDITLYDEDGEELSDSWQKNGSVEVSFTGDAIDEAKENSSDAEIIHVDEDGNADLVKTIPMSEKNLDQDGVSFDAKHFSVYGLTFSAKALVEGESFTFDEDTGTLTITDSTGDYTSSSVSDSPYYTYKSKIKKIVVDGDENTVIGSYAFYSFSNLESVEIISCGDIKDHAFNLCSNLKTVEIGTCGNIGDRAFGSCSKLETFTLGTGGDFDVYVFQNCSKLKQVDIGTCGSISEDVFNGCSGLETIKFDTCGDIADSVFSNKSKLTTVEIGSCGNIGASAFNGCSALAEMSLINCGDIGNKAFYNCPALKDITITKCGNIGQSAFGKTGEQITIQECGDIQGYAFADNSNPFAGGPLKGIKIGSCGSIGGSAFTYLKNLETVEIGSCTSIGSQAFAFDSGLKNVTIKQCSLIGDTAFMSAGAPIEELTLANCEIEESGFYMVKIDNLTLKNNVTVGANAFQSSTIQNIALSNLASLGEAAFAGCKGLTSLTIENLEEIKEDTFEVYDTTLGNNVTSINLANVNYIGDYAFSGFENLETVNIDGTCGYVGAHAFSGCKKLTTINIADETRLGYSDSFVNQQYIHDRVNAILAGTFDMTDPETPIDKIAPEGWYSNKTGLNNKTEKAGDTQLTKEAQWSNTDKTIADVLIKAYYTTQRQMDFIFVADCSNSMSGFGSSDAMNSNFYNMQSKMMDVTMELLNNSDLDTKVAFSTFGESESSKSEFFGKGQGEEAEKYIWNQIVNYESNTNYSVGLADALDLVKENKGRNTTVIFISDGQPFYPGEVPDEYYGVSEADAIKAEGVQIISVLQQVPEGTLASSEENMAKIADQIFSSTDLDGFSKAINDAVDYAYTSYTLTDTVDPAFELDENSIVASSGDVTFGQDAAGNTTITWKLGGEPFKEHTLQFRENLKPGADGEYPVGTFDTNEGNAAFNDSTKDVNEVPTPQLPREADKGDLRITKTVSGSRGDTSRSFPFELTLTDKNGNLMTGAYQTEKNDGTKGQITLTDGKATFELRHEEQITIKNLPEGTRYQVAETNAYSHTSTVEGGEGVIIGGSMQIAAFENYRGGSTGGGGGGGGGGGTPGRPVAPVTPQTQEPQTPDETPGDVPPAPWYKLPVMGDEQFGPGFINDSSNQVTLPENQAAANQQSIIPQLAELHAQNNELAGWLTVPGTGFGYPVMLSQNDPYYYLHHGFDKKLDEVGIPFMGPYCTKDSMNVLIHGHNMRDVSQFGYIWNYQYPEFQKKNPTIDFKTLTDENGSYEVMAVFFAPEYGEGTENVFWWYRYIGDMNKNQFDYFVQNAKALSLYDTGVTAEYGDKLITLETCASSKDSTRLVVVARKKAAQTAAVTQ